MITPHSERVVVHQSVSAATALVAHLEKLCKFIKEFGITCERKKFRVKVVTSKIIRC